MSVSSFVNRLIGNENTLNLSPVKNWGEFESRLPTIFKQATVAQFIQFRDNNKDIYNVWYERWHDLSGSPLTSTLEVKNVALARFFVDTGVSCSTEEELNSRRYDRTPLQLAVIMGDIPIIKKLKERGADFHIKDSYTETNMMHFAALSGSIEVVELVRTWPYLEKFTGRHSSIVPEVFYAAKSGKIECLIHMLNNPPDTRPLTMPRSPCWWEDSYGENLSWMFRSNVELDALKFHCEQGSILHYAVEGGNITVVTYLTKECKVPLLLQNQFGEYAIHKAAAEGDVDMVKFLWPLYKEAGMKIDDLDINGTLLFRAVRIGSLPLTKFLVEQGASKHQGSKCARFISVLEWVSESRYKFKDITTYIKHAITL